ncbi:MAG: hypothetical protein IPQ04_09425 [Saprospiraceae bacterium]|nr:hypothetical protein [Saprospiraceae bacterium]
METNDRFHQWLKNQHPDDYRRLLRIQEANADAMQQPKDEFTSRLEALGFVRLAVTAMSDTHFFAFPGDKRRENNLTIQKAERTYDRHGKLSIGYDPGVDVFKPYGRLLTEGFYTFDEFTLLLNKMEKSGWYQEKNGTKKRLPVLTTLQREVYDSLPATFTWAQGKQIAVNVGMPERTAQRFFGNLVLFEKARKGVYMKKITFAEI